ncbi:MAG: beta-ketoacyl synthase [Porticoccaceae bacterium]|nr:beta-ketoacyl synthase [Porticoccaceae bacterium]MEA3299382.1 beta-ketoacyl synthase [Pseudomonadota bacterium]
MTALPVIVSYGGINAAGRSSFDQSYRRMVLESLGQADRQRTITGLAALMGLDASAFTPALEQAVIAGTLIRRIEDRVFNPDRAPCNQSMKVAGGDGAALRFEMSRRNLPEQLPPHWDVTDLGAGKVAVVVAGEQQVLVPDTRDFPVKAAGQLPSGFDPGAGYASRSHPRGLQMAVMGASDAINALGVDWQTVCLRVRPDQIGMYAASCLGQLDDDGWGGVLKSRWAGSRPTSKQLPMALNSMPADFINAYVLGSVGHTEAIAGACASFLYNLQAAVRDITSGARRVAIVGGSEAPVTLECIEGFMNMSALATDQAMARIDGVPVADPRRYSRPFCDNAGFVIGESSQYLILMDDALAVELGAEIHGAVPGVFIDADGIKKSISSPGPGNYITVAKAAGLVRSVLGEEAIRRRSMMFAHGSSTPQNRVTESLIFDRVAAAFGIDNWPVCAVKAYVGHSIATASGDQIVAAIGAMRHGIVPGIKTGAAIADDVHRQHLNIPLGDLEVGAGGLDAALINAKGFGGNNATGVVLSPARAEAMVAKRHGQRWAAYQQQREATRERAADYASAALRGEQRIIYRFGDGMIEDDTLEITASCLRVPGFGKPIPLDEPNPYGDMG